MPLPPLLSASLPNPTGPYNVGYANLSHLPLAPFSHPHPIHLETNRPALTVHEIGYSVFYPADVSPTSTPNGSGIWSGRSTRIRKGVSWVPEPFWGVIQGYERFMNGKTGKAESGRGLKWLAGTLGYIAGRLKIPVYPYAPLLLPSSTEGNGRLPLVIFSHGLAGTRHTYSQFCAGLASEGYVVLSVEHKDGSGPAVCLPAEDDSTGQEGEKKKDVAGGILHYIRQSDVKWPEGSDKSLTHFRTLQLDIRAREIYETYHSFSKLVNAPASACADAGSTSTPTEGDSRSMNLTTSGVDPKDLDKRTEWIESLKGKVDPDDLRLTGHSFGGGTVLHILQTPTPDPLLPTLPVKQAIALDPWLEPIPLPAASTKAHPDMPPILVINSVGFTEWTTHFERLVKMVKEAKGSLLTIHGVGHQAFSDFPLLDPRSHGLAKELLNKIHDLSSAFLSCELAQSSDIEGKTPDEGKFEREDEGQGSGGGGGKKGMKKDKDGNVVVHILGKE